METIPHANAHCNLKKCQLCVCLFMGTFNLAIPLVLHTIIKIGRVSQTQIVNVLLDEN